MRTDRKKGLSLSISRPLGRKPCAKRTECIVFLTGKLKDAFSFFPKKFQLPFTTPFQVKVNCVYKGSVNPSFLHNSLP
jgi:hypothetical protein